MLKETIFYNPPKSPFYKGGLVVAIESGDPTGTGQAPDSLTTIKFKEENMRFIKYPCCPLNRYSSELWLNNKNDEWLFDDLC
jgi:hypothetical protein